MRKTQGLKCTYANQICGGTLPINSLVYLWSRWFLGFSPVALTATNSRHLSKIIQLPEFMGYINPARSSAMNVKLSTLGQGYGSFKGLFEVQAKSPVKMISYGIVNHSNLTQAREVRRGSGNPLFVKSVNIFPLPGEWERTVGFIGTCANTGQLLFTPYQGALSYCTRMVPATSMLIPGLVWSETDSIYDGPQSPVPVWHQGIPRPSQHLTQAPVWTLLDCRCHGMKVRSS